MVTVIIITIIFGVIAANIISVLRERNALKRNQGFPGTRRRK